MQKLKEVYYNWKKNKEIYVKRSSISAYTLLANNHILPFFGEMTEISENSVQDFVVSKINGGLSQKSVKDIIIVLKMILKYGKKLKMFDYEPFDIQYPTDHSIRKIDVLNIADFKKLMEYVKDNFSFKNLGILITISTGMRIGEVCALTWDDIDLENGTINIAKTIQRIYNGGDGNSKRKTELIIDTAKTKNSQRDVPLSPDLLKVIRPLMKMVRPEYFILSCDPKPIEPRSYRAYYQNLMVSLELPPIKFHSLRHTFASRLISAKVDVKTVSVMLGHSNISTTFNLYVHPNMEDKKNAIGKLFKSMK